MSLHYADSIKELVTPKEVCEQYGIEVNRGGFARCVFHSERTGSMKIYKDGYHCFGCGAHGSVIDLVMGIFDLPFAEAAEKINHDFRLGLSITSESSHTTKREDPAVAEKIKKRQIAKLERAKLESELREAEERYQQLKAMKEQFSPKNEGDPILGSYLFACRTIDAALDKVNQAEQALSEFEYREHQKENEP